MAQLYYSPISINSGQVPSTQTDFPVLVSVTDARFKTTGNGGHVANSNGFDIRPYTDTTLVTAITGYELERYNASTGEVIMWVKVSSLTSSSTPIVLGYGDTSLTTDGSSTTTWSNSFADVYHLNGSNLLKESKGGSNLIQSGSSNVTAGTGIIAGDGAFVSASSEYLVGADFSANAITYTMWANATSLPNSNNAVVVKNASNTSFIGIYVKSNGKLQTLVRATTQLQYNGTGSHTLSTGTWYYLAVTYDSTNGLIGYVNAASDGTVAANGNASTYTAAVQIGNANPDNKYWDGGIDEVRLASVARSADWITTEYNNQSAPGTFETLGTEVATGAGASTSNFFLLFP